MSKYYQGFFKPKHPGKYKGNPTQIVYRSKWELGVMMQLDHDPTIIEWGSEEIIIGYISPADGRPHRYFPDFFWKKKSPNGRIETTVCEVKPHSQTVMPKQTANKPMGRRFLKEATTYAVNTAKFEAATNYCNKRGWKFIILTEKELFPR